MSQKLWLHKHIEITARYKASSYSVNSPLWPVNPITSCFFSKQWTFVCFTHLKKKQKTKIQKRRMEQEKRACVFCFLAMPFLFFWDLKGRGSGFNYGRWVWLVQLVRQRSPQLLYIHLKIQSYSFSLESGTGTHCLLPSMVLTPHATMDTFLGNKIILCSI